MNFDTDDKIVSINGKSYPLDPEVFKLLYSLSVYKEGVQAALTHHIDEGNLVITNVDAAKFIAQIT